jgi:cytochrome c biogenesis protein CcdA
MEIITLFSLFILGISYGSTACMFSCMPFLTPLLVTNSGSIASANKVVIPFSLGRVTSYIFISMFASYSAIFTKTIIKDTQTFQILLGLFTISMSLYLFYKIFNKNSSCGSSNVKVKTKGSFAIFIMGLLISLNPCVPVLTLISFSTNTTTLSEGFLYGLFFGFGAVITPYVFYTLLVSNIVSGLIEAFKKYSKIIELSSIAFLFLVGCLILLGKVNL